MMTVIKNIIFLFLVFTSVSFASVDYNQPLTSDAETIALWHMNTISRANVGDTNTAWIENDPVNSDKQLNILNISGIKTPPGQAVAGPIAALGNAVYLSGPTVVGWEIEQTGPNVWSNNYDTVKLEGWMKLDNTLGGTRNVIESNVWYLQRWSNGSAAELGFAVVTDGGIKAVWIPITSIPDSTWLHFTAAFDKNGQLSLTVFNLDHSFYQIASADYSGRSIVDTSDGTLWMGWKIPITLDEVRLSVTGCPGGFLSADFNRDCYVNINDFSQFVNQWLQSTEPQF